MSTMVMMGLSNEIKKLEKLLKKKNLTEWERRWAEYKIVEKQFWLWAQTQGYEERQRARHESTR
jgi:hypothetical protein